jgi:hypothetical protein
MNYQQLTKVVYNTDISILDYLILLNVYYHSEQEFLKDERFKGHFAYLQSLGYLSLNNKLTLEGKNLIEFEIGIPKYESKVDSDYFVELHKKLQTRLFELTGKKQSMLQGKYAFLCNSKDLQNKLTKVITKYGLKDLNRIEKILLNYVNKCVKARFDKVQLIEYFIMKDNISALATAYENYEDIEVDNKIETTESGVHLI